MMKALRINPQTQTIEVIDITGMDDIIREVGYDTIESDSVGSDGDRLYFDEECFLRGTEGRFQIDTLIPVSGIAILAAGDETGPSADVHTDIEALRARIKYL